MSEAKPAGPITLWTNYGGDGWAWQDFASVKEALEADKWVGTWVITRPIHYSIQEQDGAGE